MKWKTIPIFISSTFFDMHHERDVMLPQVFAHLDEVLRPRLASVEPIDLRWGVDASGKMGDAEKMEHIIHSCLNELKRSELMVVMLGGRYGTLVNKPLLSKISKGRALSFDDGLVSITSMEIEYGLSMGTALKVDVYDRRVNYETVPEEERGGYCDLFQAEAEPDPKKKAFSEQAASTLERLKLSLGQDEAPCSYSSYGGSSVEDAALSLSEILKTDLKKRLLEMTADRVELGPYDSTEIKACLAYHVANSEASGLRGSPFQQELINYAQTGLLNGEPADGVVLMGDPGGGKSAQLAVCANTLAEGCEGPLVLCHFANLTEETPYLNFLLKKWCEKLGEELGRSVNFDGPVGDNVHGLKKQFWDLLNEVSPKRDVLILLDGLDELERSDAARNVSWLPVQLPPNVRFVCTSGSGQEERILAGRPGVSRLEIPGLGQTQVQRHIEAFARSMGKTIDASVVERIFTKQNKDGRAACENPLWLQTVTRQLMLIDGEELKRARAKYAEKSPEEQINLYLCELVDALPGDIGPGLVHLVDRVHGLMRRLFDVNWGREAVKLLAVSRGGLRVSDLRALLGSNEPVEPGIFEQHFAILKLYLAAHLYSKPDGRWSLSNVAARKTLLENLGTEALVGRHRKIASHLTKECVPGDLLQRETLFYHLINGHRWEEAVGLCVEGDETSIDILGEVTVALLRERSEEEYMSVAMSWQKLLERLQAAAVASQKGSDLGKVLLFSLYSQVEPRLSYKQRAQYLESVAATIQGLVEEASQPRDRDFLQGFCDLRHALVLQALGVTNVRALLEGALEKLSDVQLVTDPENSSDRWDGFVVQRTIVHAKTAVGDSLLRNGDRDGARKAFDGALRILFELRDVAWGSNVAFLNDVDLGITQTKYGDTLDTFNDRRKYFGSAWMLLTKAAEQPRPSFLMLGHPLTRVCRKLSDLYLKEDNPKSLALSKQFADHAERWRLALLEYEPLNPDYQAEPRAKILD